MQGPSWLPALCIAGGLMLGCGGGGSEPSPDAQVTATHDGGTTDGSVDRPDAGPHDAGPTDGQVPGASRPNGYGLTSGGGVMEGGAHRLRVHVGGGIVQGTTAGGDLLLEFGPRAGP